MIGTIEVCCFRLQQGQLQVLLSKRKSEPYLNQFGLIGGGILPAEDTDIRDTAIRILRQRANISSQYLEQVNTLANNHRDPRDWSICCLFLAIITPEQKVLPHCKWINVFDLINSKVNLAFDHLSLIQQALLRLINKTQYSSLPVHFFQDQFTLPELQDAFETILRSKLPKAAFRRRLNRPDILVETGEKDRSQNRPAALYRSAEQHLLVHYDQLMKGHSTTHSEIERML
ncbi:hypothetical protein K6Y31_15215 [Motilimonas cestriensis]|uniref:NrtR DNA-binding winged helix domain-containing protein n=1 Tax=Motilimonas cestriensis TaxID=2742685 RepID=A0ABS8WCV9_9GAMM|nr:hypothetical protein [Motilimonas cestriensis]MCE2596162.1 hypothetical protein [Motilimonas cestriensis]